MYLSFITDVPQSGPLFLIVLLCKHICRFSGIWHHRDRQIQQYKVGALQIALTEEKVK